MTNYRNRLQRTTIDRSVMLYVCFFIFSIPVLRTVLRELNVHGMVGLWYEWC